uniref:Minor capsid protein P9 transmembrane helices domain-containing protein n=1 Tax=viral metagenome TaxID=1070528 RepID=A0A6C0AWZ7_9ZZZZ|tara:strand:- start:7874 stop:8599 length:726 start_codon:yes stop_codon:yes gene_type:complete
MTTVYWLEDPKILFDKENIIELWPTSNMTYIEKMNALCRLIVFLTIIGLIIFRSLNILIIGLIVLCILTFLYNKKIITEQGRVLYDNTSYENDKKEMESKNNSKDVNKNTSNNSKKTKESFVSMLPWKDTELVLSESPSMDKQNPLNNHLLSDSIGSESKVKKTNKQINNAHLLDTIRDNTSIMNNIKLEKDLESNFNLDRQSRQYYKVPEYDKATLNYLTGNSATVKDNMFIEKKEKFTQ